MDEQLLLFDVEELDADRTDGQIDLFGNRIGQDDKRGDEND